MKMTIKNTSGAALVPPKPFLQVSMANAASRTDEVRLSSVLANEDELRQMVAKAQIELSAPVVSDAPQHDFLELLLLGLTQPSVEKHANINIKDAAAGTATKRAILVAGAKGAVLKEARIYGVAASAADGTNYATMTLKIMGTDGTTVASTPLTRATNVTGIAAGHEKPAFTGGQGLALTEGQTLVFEAAKAGTGVALDLGLEVLYTDNPTLKAATTI